jgi:hypothetical protein
MARSSCTVISGAGYHSREVGAMEKNIVDINLGQLENKFLKDRFDQYV